MAVKISRKGLRCHRCGEIVFCDHVSKFKKIHHCPQIIKYHKPYRYYQPGTQKFCYADPVSDGALGIYYNGRTEKLTIGGYTKFRFLMDAVIKQYFGRITNGITEKYTAKNKIKFDMHLSEKRFNDTMVQMQRDGMTIKIVKSLGKMYW